MFGQPPISTNICMQIEDALDIKRLDNNSNSLFASIASKAKNRRYLICCSVKGSNLTGFAINSLQQSPVTSSKKHQIILWCITTYLQLDVEEVFLRRLTDFNVF